MSVVMTLRNSADLKWKKIYNNTWKAVDSEGTVHIKLHNTIIYTRTEGGTITLNSGGHRTHTTKKRLNSLLEGTPIRVFQKDFDWFVTNIRSGEVWPFHDGWKLAEWQ